MSRTRVFEYRGFLGIESSVDADGLINSPTAKGQIGFIVRADCCDIQPSALEVLKSADVCRGDIGDVDIFDSGGIVCFAWIGGPKKVLPKEFVGGAGYAPNLITPCDFETPTDFKEAVDNILNL